MLKASTLRNGMALASVSALPLAFCPTFAEARGVGVGFQSPVQDARSVGRATNSPEASLEMVSQADGVIVAERAPVQVRARDATTLVEELRLLVAAQPTAMLNIRWQLTRPAEAK